MPHNIFSKIFLKAFDASVKSNPQAQMLLSRRKFLRNTALAGAGMALVPSLLHAKKTDDKKGIVIVGAGIAGLNAAYQLKKLGYPSTLYEAASRVGGRMFTLTDYFGEGLTTDIGGEFVDENHEDLIQLAKELNVECYDLRSDKLKKETLFFEGKLRSEEELMEAIKPFIEQIVKDIASLPEELTYRTAASFAQLDSQSVKEYITTLGVSGWLYGFIDLVLSREYGMDIEEQSALNLLIMLDKNGQFYEGHEVYKIKGGSQHLAEAVYQKVKDSVKLQHELTAVKQNFDLYELCFSNNNNAVKVTADFVILALPFTVLRSIQMDVPMPAEKRKCIDEFTLGNSSKFIKGTGERPWRNNNQQGYTFTDEKLGCGWDSAHMQPYRNGSYTVFGGGKSSDEIFNKEAAELSNDFTTGINKIFPGSEKIFSDRHVKMCWAKQPFAKGGYTSFKKGQYSTIAGWEAAPVGNIFFAGEHVSGPFQGFMNGAAQTGRFAAAAVATKIKKEK